MQILSPPDSFIILVIRGLNRVHLYNSDGAILNCGVKCMWYKMCDFRYDARYKLTGWPKKV